MNFNTARQNMLLNQIRTWDFISPENLDLIGKLQREEFVPVDCRKLAFTDFEIPLAHGEFMLKPILEGRILQSLNLTGKEKILEIGTGSAYMTALLAQACEHVTSIDIYQDFTDDAIDKLVEAGINNTKCSCHDVFTYSSTYKYDCIVATGSFAQVPEFLLKNIKQEGKIFAIVGNDPIMSAIMSAIMPAIMSACIITKGTNGQAIVETLFETIVQPLQANDETTIFEL